MCVCVCFSFFVHLCHSCRGGVFRQGRGCATARRRARPRRCVRSRARFCAARPWPRRSARAPATRMCTRPRVPQSCFRSHVCVHARPQSAGGGETKNKERSSKPGSSLEGSKGLGGEAGTEGGVAAEPDDELAEVVEDVGAGKDVGELAAHHRKALERHGVERLGRHGRKERVRQPRAKENEVHLQ